MRCGMSRLNATLIAVLLAEATFAHQDDVARWDPNMAVQGVAVDTNGVKWVDGRCLPLEGKCFSDVRKNNFVRSLYEKLVAEGWDRLVYLPGDGMYNDDLEGTVDGIHPNDRGMETMARAYGDAVKKALGLDS